MIIGSKVKTNITDFDRYSGHSGYHLTNQTGVIRAFKPDYGFTLKDPHYLVEFDNPVTPWREYQLPITAFWFPTNELI